MARILDSEIDRLKGEISVERLAESQGILLENRGHDRVGLCPFHDDKEPSLIITPSKNLWHCLGACQAGGSVIDWVMRADGVSFRHAVELLLLFYPHGRFRYSFKTPATNGEGKVIATFGHLEGCRRRNAHHNLTDYNTPLAECDDRIVVQTPTGDEMREGYDSMLRSLPERRDEVSGWRNARNDRVRAEIAEAHLEPSETSVRIVCELTDHAS